MPSPVRYSGRHLRFPGRHTARQWRSGNPWQPAPCRGVDGSLRVGDHQDTLMPQAPLEFNFAAFARTVDRIAEALERLAPPAPIVPLFDSADAFVWHPEGRRLAAVPRVNRVAMTLLKGIDRVRDVLVENTERFAEGLPANNALLWGARGMGKSSLVKAAHASVNANVEDRKSVV